MAASGWNPISVRNEVIDAFPGTTGQATALYHGAIACVNSSGYVEDYSSTSLVKLTGIVYSVEGKAGSTGDVITTQGSVNQGIHLVNLITEGRIDSIPFNSDLSADDVGKPAYAYDNFTLTPDPTGGTNMSPIGIITKYYTSSKGEVRLTMPVGGVLEKTMVLTTTTSSIMMAIANPLGVDCILETFQCVVTTAASSAHAVSAGIATTSTSVATDVVATGAIAMGTTGVYGTAKTTNFFGNITWPATKSMTLTSSSGIGTAGALGTLDGFIRIRFRPAE